MHWAEKNDDIIVVGSGLAGLACALELAPKSVTVITKTPTLAGGSSLWAQGGIAAAIGPGDSPERHALDTLKAGAGLCEPHPVRELTEESATSLQWLLELGVPFDRVADGTLALAQEAVHESPRVVHAGGDTTGFLLMQTLIERVSRTPSIKVMVDTFSSDLVVNNGRVEGLIAFSAKTGWTFHRSPNVVLATGGIGTTWLHTTNPLEASGDGLAMAARAGDDLKTIGSVTRALMWQHVGVQRSGVGLQATASRLLELEDQLIALSLQNAPEQTHRGDFVRLWGEVRNRLLVARLVTLAALRREESRGAHCRSDFPAARPEWQHRKAMTVAALAEAH